MLAALSEFHAELVESAEGFEIVVTLGIDGRGDEEVMALLKALEQYISERGAGPARIELGGQRYLMRPDVGGA